MSARRSIPLNEHWQFRDNYKPESAFKATAGFPTEIFRDLFHHDLIPDPFTRKNENDVQWVGARTWHYRTTFNTPTCVGNENAVLDFSGLDTFATVSLNGKIVLMSENMFLPARAEVTGLLSPVGMGNVLEIVFDSAESRGRKIVKGNAKHVWVYSNGEQSRLAVRKAQYHYGWDWGPRLMTCGPWRPINLELYSSRISDCHITTRLSDDLKTAEIDIVTSIEGDYETILFDITLDGESIIQESVNAKSDTARVVFKTQNPSLWYPRGYGIQALYTMVVTIFDRSFVALDTLTKRIGIRKAVVRTHGLVDSKGSSFSFEINNIPIFCGGSNWIPADSFLTRLTATTYRDWVQMLARGNQIMLRVWAGGIYEDDEFYDACDEGGILVWQDFMFACGNYPAMPQFLESVRQEAIANVKRLRSHPCIVIWAGNNEDYQIAESEGLEYDPQEKDPEQWLTSSFPARYIYEKLLRDVMAEYARHTHYHFGSPYGGETSGDPKVGDLHQWNVWHGTQERYQDWDKLSGRFVSEFGMQALPNMRTVNEFFGKEDTKERYPESSTVSFHNKAVGHDRRLGIYLTENLRYRFEPFGYYVYCTQVMQAECIASAFRQWKRQWKGPGREFCAGALVWQANDCWPCTSWSIVDHHRRPKLAYYAIKREMESLTVGMKRVIGGKQAKNVVLQTLHEIELWVCNLQTREVEANILISSYNLDTGAHQTHPDLARQVVAWPSRSTEVATFNVPAPQEEHDQTVIIATLVFDDSSSTQHHVNWPEPLKYAHLPHPSFEVCVLRQSATDDDRLPKHVDLHIRATTVAKSVEIDIEGEDNADADLFDDNGFDMVPEVVKVVKVRPPQRSGIEGPRIRFRYLGCKGDGWAEIDWECGSWTLVSLGGDRS